MFINNLSGPYDNYHMDVSHPDLEAVEAAIRALNGSDATLVAVVAGEEVPHLVVGGGNGSYIVYATYDNENFYNLLAPGKNPLTKKLVVAGGQEGDFSEEQCVDLPSAVRAALTFAESGELDTALSWSKQN